MSKTIVIVGFGPGISFAMADKFGAEGFSVALVARNEDRLAAGVAALKAKGVKAAAFPADASNPDSIGGAMAKVSDTLGPITVLHWNAISGLEVTDLIEADPAAVRDVFDVAVVGLMAAVQAALPDLKAEKDAAILVTNGAFGDLLPMMDAMAVHLKHTGVALANAAKGKLVGLLSEQLKGDGIYVGEVSVAGVIKGTGWGDATIEGATVADKFWELYQARGEIRGRVVGLF